MNSLPCIGENKHKEWNTIQHIAKTIGFPDSLTSKRNTQISCKLSLPPFHNNTSSNPKQWATFTYCNSVMRKVINPFKGTNIHIAFHIKYMIQDILKI